MNEGELHLNTTVWFASSLYREIAKTSNPPDKGFSRSVATELPQLEATLQLEAQFRDYVSLYLRTQQLCVK